MKKSELKQIIREEIQKLKEAVNLKWKPYDHPEDDFPKGSITSNYKSLDFYYIPSEKEGVIDTSTRQVAKKNISKLDFITDIDRLISVGTSEHAKFLKKIGYK